jgi:hypothetical protein
MICTSAPILSMKERAEGFAPFLFSKEAFVTYAEK